MIIEHSNVKKMMLTELDRLDPISVIAENFDEGQGKITITCYGKSWTAYWGAMGEQTISEFFRTADNQYLMGYLSPSTDSKIYDEDKIEELAKKKGLYVERDDPWNDYDFMEELYGNDRMEWGDSLPKKPNHEYEYICRIIDAVKSALEIEANSIAA